MRALVVSPGLVCSVERSRLPGGYALFLWKLSPGTVPDDLAMKSSVVKQSVVINGHHSSVSIEGAFWNALKEIAVAQN